MNIKTKAFIGGLIGVVVISAAFSFSGCGEKPVKEYYKSGQLESESFYKNGKIEGVFRRYYKNGQRRNF